MIERNIYKTLASVEDAQEVFFGRGGRSDACGAWRFSQTPETVPAENSSGRVTTRPVYAKFSAPLYDSAAMDGIAVSSGATTGASESSPVVLRRGADFEAVDTGDPVPEKFDAVVMTEQVRYLEDGSAEIRAAVSPWQDVRPIGEDVVQGEMVLPGAHRIRPIDVGMLLSAGITEIEVLRKPVIAIIPTGTEIIEPGKSPEKGDIIESNSRMIAALLEQDGAVPVRLDTIPDDRALLKKTVAEAAGAYDMVFVLSGTSAGREDFTAPVLAELGTVLVNGVAIKPGKPVILAEVGGKPVVGVPGYPVSAWICYSLFGRGAVRILCGKPPGSLSVSDQGESDCVRAVLTRRVVSSLKYREYVRVKLGKIDGRFVATPLARGAGAAMSLVRADGFCVIGQDAEGAAEGTEARVVLLRSESEIANSIVCIGSHDLVLDELNDIFAKGAFGTDVSLTSVHVGSMGGLLALEKGFAHIVPMHVLDEQTGEYNIPVLRELFPPDGGTSDVALIKGVGRTQGFIVAPGNPLGVQSATDLERVRFINRQRGAGTRILLDWLLAQNGVSKDGIRGYGKEAATHMAVAAAVHNGSADCGMGVRSAALALGLGFVPVADEEYDFAIRARHLELESIKTFIAALRSAAFHLRLDELGGYTYARAGEVVLLNAAPAE